jgi:quercetin dioxygenase-like cupin family protein
MKGANAVSPLTSGFVVTILTIGGALGILLFSSLGSAESKSTPSATTAGAEALPFSHSLPQLDGSHLRATVVEVNYVPGEADKPHSHPCTVIGYVAQGAIRFQVKGGAPETVYRAGQSFYEPPNGVHQVSANASVKEPARLIAFFICDHDTKLTVPPIDDHSGGEAK